MPIYEYTCIKCRHEFEELTRSMSEPESISCPSCQSGSVERKMSVFAARESGSSSIPMPMGGCGRCGDPNGPCSM